MSTVDALKNAKKSDLDKVLSEIEKLKEKRSEISSEIDRLRVVEKALREILGIPEIPFHINQIFPHHDNRRRSIKHERRW